MVLSTYNKEVYERDLKEEGRREGRQEGERKGRSAAQLEIAESLLDILDVETIAEKTGLTVEQVCKLKGSC